MTTFDKFAIIYDGAIDWKSRLGRELPFLQSHISQVKRPEILDLACGSGRHLIALASRGLHVVGLDKSPTMIATAKQLAKQAKVEIELVVGDMIDAKKLIQGSYDLIFCIGNSLALLENLDALKQVLAAVHSLLKDKGVFIAQTLNFIEIRQSGFRFFPLMSGQTGENKEVIFARFFEAMEPAESASLILAALTREHQQWKIQTATQRVLQLDNFILDKLLIETGFTHHTYYGNYAGELFQVEKHRNVITVATR